MRKLSKPYYRIARPNVVASSYVTDHRYAPDRNHLIMAYYSLEKELFNVLEYIEPHDDNLQVFSMKLYSFLFRACTEVEQHFKIILKANGYSREKLSIKDYRKLNKIMLLSKYKVAMKSYRFGKDSTTSYSEKMFVPFESFDNKDEDKCSPVWYKAYNDVKHNRETMLYQATLENCVNAIAGVMILLFSQFADTMFKIGAPSWIILSDEGGNWAGGERSTNLFTIYPPSVDSWEARYDFDWTDLSKEKEPFDKFWKSGNEI